MKRVMIAAAIVLACSMLAQTGCKRAPKGMHQGELVPDFVLPMLDGKVQKLSNYGAKSCS